MTVLNLTAKQDHLEKVAKTRDPIKAISEFVWNSLNAKASKVIIRFEVNALDGIETIVIEDDGHGITQDRAKTDFGNLGDSWKKSAPRKTNQRPYHGKEGRGRLRFFSVAQKAQWQTTYSKDKKYFDLSIEIDSQSLGKCDLSEAVLSSKDSSGDLHP